MPDLMNQRYLNLVAQLLYIIANSQHRVSEDHNDIGELPVTVISTTKTVMALIGAQQIHGTIRGTILNDENHIVQAIDDFVWEPVKLFRNFGFEVIECHVHVSSLLSWPCDSSTHSVFSTFYRIGSRHGRLENDGCTTLRIWG